MQYLRAVEYIQPQPAPIDVAAIIERGVEIAGKEECKEHYIPFDLGAPVVLIRLDRDCSLVEIHLDPKLGVEIASVKGWEDGETGIAYLGTHPVVMVPHPPNMVYVYLRENVPVQLQSTIPPIASKDSA